MDALDSVLNLEEDFYRGGYDLGISDGAHAGLVEGKLFGVEKGFEKALKMGRLHGRAKVWNQRLPKGLADSPGHADEEEATPEGGVPQRSVAEGPIMLRPLLGNARLRRHIDSLHAITNPTTVSEENTDEAVAKFDDRLVKAIAKAKLIANIVAEPWDLRDGKPVPDFSLSTDSIEDPRGLSARR